MRLQAILVEAGADRRNDLADRLPGRREYAQQRLLARNQGHRELPRLHRLGQVRHRWLALEAGGEPPFVDSVQPSLKPGVRGGAQIRAPGQETFDPAQFRKAQRKGPFQTGIVGEYKLLQARQATELRGNRSG